ncbi:MAG: hypothetical protein JXA25_10060 [Anaerolineales bacterium]|nr:hypothetical protein [Anaerolineales bacterium]
MISINGRDIVLDENEGLLPWTDYDHVIWLAMNFIRTCPVEPRSDLPWYLVYSCFWTDPLRPAIWPDNPAGKFAMAVETLQRYYPYSGETWFIDVVRSMLNRLAVYSTPAEADWPLLPYASAEPVFGNYFGARADGHYVIEPDKVAQAGLAYLTFFKMTGESRYMELSVQCAGLLARKIRAGDESHSPWPFRVFAFSGEVVEEYSSQVIAAIKLFDQLIDLQVESAAKYEEARQIAWRWLLHFPLRNNCWKGYFEDIRLDPQNINRDQYSALETARYLLQHPDRDPNWAEHAGNLLRWVQEELGADPFYKAMVIHEQKYCFHVMGSHTARYASVCALYSSLTGDRTWADQARLSFNWATYMADENGWVRVGIDPPDYYNQCWFTDGYFDYVPHFLDGMASLPDLAPESTDHLLSTTSVIKQISYSPGGIRYSTFDPSAQELLKVTFRPSQVRCKNQPLSRKDAEDKGEGWCFQEEKRLLTITHIDSDVEILGEKG